MRRSVLLPPCSAVKRPLLVPSSSHAHSSWDADIAARSTMQSAALHDCTPTAAPPGQCQFRACARSAPSPDSRSNGRQHSVVIGHRRSVAGIRPNRAQAERRRHPARGSITAAAVMQRRLRTRLGWGGRGAEARAGNQSVAGLSGSPGAAQKLGGSLCTV